MDRSIIQDALNQITQEHEEDKANYYRSEGAIRILNALLQFEDSPKTDPSFEDNSSPGCSRQDCMSEEGCKDCEN